MDDGDSPSIEIVSEAAVWYPEIPILLMESTEPIGGCSP
jgi:hypothetical protein